MLALKYVNGRKANYSQFTNIMRDNIKTRIYLKQKHTLIIKL